jgi:hypothetical protein
MPSVSVTLFTSRTLAHELFEPQFQVQSVAQHQVGRLRLHDIQRRRFILVNLRAGLCDGFDDRPLSPATFWAMSARIVKVVTTRLRPSAAPACPAGRRRRRAAIIRQRRKESPAKAFIVCFNPAPASGRL